MREGSRERGERKRERRAASWWTKAPGGWKLELGSAVYHLKGNHLTPVSQLSGFSETKKTCAIYFQERIFVQNIRLVAVRWFQIGGGGLSILSKYKKECISSLVWAWKGGPGSESPHPRGHPSAWKSAPHVSHTGACLSFSKDSDSLTGLPVQAASVCFQRYNSLEGESSSLPPMQPEPTHFPRPAPHGHLILKPPVVLLQAESLAAVRTVFMWDVAALTRVIKGWHDPAEDRRAHRLPPPLMHASSNGFSAEWGLKGERITCTPLEEQTLTEAGPATPKQPEGLEQTLRTGVILPRHWIPLFTVTLVRRAAQNSRRRTERWPRKEKQNQGLVKEMIRRGYRLHSLCRNKGRGVQVHRFCSREDRAGLSVQTLSGAQQDHTRDSGQMGVVGGAGELMPCPEGTAVLWPRPTAASRESGPSLARFLA